MEIDKKFTGKITDERGNVHHYASGQYMGSDIKLPKPGAYTFDFSATADLSAEDIDAEQEGNDGGH